MLRPIIMIGCGGSGQKTDRYVRDAMRRRLMHAGRDKGIPQAWQFLGIDTGGTQEDGSIPFLPNNDYVCLLPQISTFPQLDNAILARFGPGINPTCVRRSSRSGKGNPDSTDSGVVARSSEN